MIKLYSKYCMIFIAISVLSLCSNTSAIAQIAIFNPTGLSNYGPSPWSPTSPPPAGAIVNGMTRGAGVTTSGTAAGSAWGGNGWSQTNAADAISGNKYVYFTMQADVGYTISLSSWDECYRRSGTGPANGLLQYSINAGPYTDIATLAFTNTSSSGACLGSVNLSSIAALQNVPAGDVITFRIAPYGATSTSGTWYIFQSSGLQVSGTVTAVPTCNTPTGLAAANITAGSADLSWNSVAGAVNYEYIVDQSAATPAVPGTVTTNTFYNATGLAPATTYYLHVRANCGAAYSAWATAYSFTTLPQCPDPTGVAANNITAATADLSWNNIPTALNYEYIVDQNPATPAVPGTVTTNAFYNATGLAPATTYYLHVRANCANPNYSAWITISFTTLPQCPDPTGLAANNITASTADLSWNNIPTALNYEYIVDQDPATPAVPGTVTTNLTYNATGLTPATTYYLHVRSNCANPNYSAWVTISFTTLPQCPDPTGLAANNITTTSADLSWDNIPTALNYEYIVDQDPATPAVPGTVTTNLTYNATGLTPANTYYLHVRTNCANPNYSAWITISFTTLAPCPDPTGLAANNITTTSADLSWDNIPTALNYEYIVNQDPATPAVPGTVTTNTFYNATGLAPTTTYYLHVRANCANPNYSAWITVSFTTLTPCPDPTGLAANNITTTTADLSWNNIPTALNYEYIVDQDPSTPAVPGTVTNNLTYNATGLTPSTTYYLHVRSNCGTPNYSAWVTISFTTIDPCPDPTGLAASLVTDVSATLSWDSLAGADFEYTIDQLPTAPAVPGTPTVNSTYYATGLSPATVYYLHVRRDCGGNNLSAWVSIPFTTMNAPASILVGWDVNGLSDYGPSPFAPTTIPALQVASGGLRRGDNISVPALPAQATNNAWGGMNFYGTPGPFLPNTQQDLIDNNAFLYFTVKSQPGYTVSLNSFDMFFGRYSADAPETVTLQYSIDSTTFVDLGTATHATVPYGPYYSFPTIDLSGIPALQNVTSGSTIYFRLVPVQSANDTETAAWYVFDGNTDPLLYEGADIFLRGSWDISLPLQLVSFTGFAGHNSGDGNMLSWVTANEQGIKDFTLERAYDGKSFETLAAIKAKGNTTGDATYQYNDKAATAAHTFYRLKITDMNGLYKYSNVIDIYSKQSDEISIYPNPVHTVLNVNTHNSNEHYTINVTDVLGRSHNMTASGNSTNGILSIDMSALSEGVYVLQLVNSNSLTTRSIRFVKQ